jgi:hypothetical protein
MKIQIISEGPTDREIIRALIIKFSSVIEFLPESKTQRSYRGKASLISNYRIFAKFLHNAYNNLSDIIIICSDNDGEELDRFGVGLKKKESINSLVLRFTKENSYKYPSINPTHILAVPVQTIDYWVKCVKEPELDCYKIRTIEEIPKEMIKKLAYGEKNVHLGWLIDRKAFDGIMEKIEQDPNALDKLLCLPSFRDFRDQLVEHVNS